MPLQCCKLELQLFVIVLDRVKESLEPLTGFYCVLCSSWKDFSMIPVLVTPCEHIQSSDLYCDAFTKKKFYMLHL